jgi:acyl-CoA thioester hydrolase
MTGSGRFEKEFEVRGTDLDINRHLTSPAYLAYAIHTRMSAFDSLGLMQVLDAEGLAPVVVGDDLRYRRELRVFDTVRVSMELAGLSTDDSRWRLRHEFVRDDGTLCATVLTDGTWFSLESRKVTVPPATLARGFAKLSRTADFAELPSWFAGKGSSG